MKHIIREVAPENCDFSFYFDDDGLTEAGGDFCYNLFIIGDSRHVGSFNIETYKSIQFTAGEIIDAFSLLEEGNKCYFDNFKNAICQNGIEYTSHKCHLLREWAKTADAGDVESIAEFLTIDTGKKWKVASAYGYCQGDYIEMLYCTDNYKNGVQAYGEVWLGAAREFCVIEVDDDGNEGDTCYGFIVADCQAWTDEDYKRLVCEWGCLDEKETILEMIDGCNTQTVYSYRTA